MKRQAVWEENSLSIYLQVSVAKQSVPVRRFRSMFLFFCKCMSEVKLFVVGVKFKVSNSEIFLQDFLREDIYNWHNKES